MRIWREEYYTPWVGLGEKEKQQEKKGVLLSDMETFPFISPIEMKNDPLMGKARGEVEEWAGKATRASGAGRDQVVYCGACMSFIVRTEPISNVKYFLLYAILKDKHI